MMPEDPQKTQRIAYAETLTEFNQQQAWYSKRATELKSKAERLDLLVIAMGALIAAIPILNSASDSVIPQILVSFLGAAVAIGQGAQKVFRYSETWPEYRLASERMKREHRLFINAATPYTEEGSASEKDLVVRLEGIIADEQKVFFDLARSSRPSEEAQ